MSRAPVPLGRQFFLVAAETPTADGGTEISTDSSEPASLSPEFFFIAEKAPTAEERSTKKEQCSITIATLFRGATTRSKELIRTGVANASGNTVAAMLSRSTSRFIRDDEYLHVDSNKDPQEVMVEFIFSEGTELALRCGSWWYRKVLHWAVEAGDHEFLKLALEQGADANQRDWFNETALHMAAKKLDIDAIKLLIENGADVNALDESKSTPLHYARVDDDSELQDDNDQIQNRKDKRLMVVRNLLEYSAHKGYKDEAGNTVLHLAIIYKHMTLVKTLLKKKAGINAKNMFGRTALHLAVKGGDVKVVKYLLRKGADTKIKDNDNLTFNEKWNEELVDKELKMLQERLGIEVKDMDSDCVGSSTILPNSTVTIMDLGQLYAKTGTKSKNGVDGEMDESDPDA